MVSDQDTAAQDRRGVAVRLRVRYAETDGMGIVHHSRYLPWLEMGRTELMRAHGFTYRKLEEMGVNLTVIEVNVRYRRPARYDDPIVVYTRLAEFGRVRVRFEYKVYNEEDNALLCEAYTEHAFVGRDGRPIRVERQFPEAWAVLQQVVASAQAAEET
jgi:acyl-CoA thioester hydrolase